MAEPQRGQIQSEPQVVLHWEGWEETQRTERDTLDRAEAGKAITLALMTIGREIGY